MKGIEFEGIPVSVIRSDRKTIAIQIQPDGICVRAPRKITDREISDVLMQKRSWIQKHMQKMEKQNARAKDMEPFTKEELELLAEKAAHYIPPRVKHYAKLIGVDYGRITIRNQRTRWGSCSSKGNLNFNCLLMLFPPVIVDSVVVHELCHRKHMNHSPQFYAEVEKVFPEYQRCHKWLNENGGIYLRRLP